MHGVFSLVEDVEGLFGLACGFVSPVNGSVRAGRFVWLDH